jgi:hypothetical protein
MGHGISEPVKELPDFQKVLESMREHRSQIALIDLAWPRVACLPGQVLESKAPLFARAMLALDDSY